MKTPRKPAIDKAKASKPGNPAAQAGGSSAFGGHSSTIFGGGPSFLPPAPTLLTVFSQSIAAELMPETLKGSQDFEEYLGQFNAAAYLSSWCHPGLHHHRPEFSALRLKGIALIFLFNNFRRTP